MSTIESPRERLERLRAEVPALEAAARLRVAEDAVVAGDGPLPVAPGDQIHAKVTGVTFATGRGFTSASHVTTAGETYTITQQLLEASRDAGGRSWLRHLVSDEAQVRRWGAVRFGIGPAPEGMTPEPGTAEHREAREQARREAWAQPTAQARTAALAAVESRFGPAPISSTTISTTPDPSIAAAAAQRARLDNSGPKFWMKVEAREAGAKR